MKNILVRHAYEIFDLSVKTQVDVGIAMEYFANNCFTYPDILHPGIDFDYKNASREWKAMDIDGRCDAKIEWSKFLKNHYHDLGNTYAAKDKDKFDHIVEDYICQ